jgi:hypothetical protein
VIGEIIFGLAGAALCLVAAGAVAGIARKLTRMR